MDSTSESSRALTPVMASGVAVPDSEVAVADLVDAATDAHHRIRTSLTRLAGLSGVRIRAVLQYRAPDEARLEASLDKARCDIYRIRGPV